MASLEQSAGPDKIGRQAPPSTGCKMTPVAVDSSFCRGTAALAILLVALAGYWHWGIRRPKATPPADPFPLTPISPSAFLNTNPVVAYVGSDACRSCHAGHERSFRRTAMGRSMAEVDVGHEPADAVFDHPPSKRRYQIQRKGGQLWHREFLLTGAEEQVMLAEHAVRYVVGSGHHSRTYLIEVEGFLQESPATWYASLNSWGMSPGYDSPDQGGFVRPVSEACISCHAGRVEVIDRSLHRFRVIEPAIGCERCHGPGALHVASRRAGDAKIGVAPDATDTTIVNPAQLPRELAEAICQHCHLQGDAVVVARGRRPADFRPGLALQDFRHDYRLETADPAMTVTGHVEQLHRSRCYQAAPTLTCTTCHDPHAAKAPTDPVQAANASCAKCHAPEKCTVSKQRRDRESPNNHCIQCHMPRAATEIPHLAFTHHRIGIHAPRSQSQTLPPKSTALVSVLDLSRLSEAEKKHSLGLAYLEIADKQLQESAGIPWKERGLERLQAAAAAGLRDPLAQAALERIRFELRKISPADDAALTHADLTGNDRCRALFLLAYVQFQRGDVQDAEATLRSLTLRLTVRLK